MVPSGSILRQNETRDDTYMRTQHQNKLPEQKIRQKE